MSLSLPLPLSPHASRSQIVQVFTRPIDSICHTHPIDSIRHTRPIDLFYHTHPICVFAFSLAEGETTAALLGEMGLGGARPSLPPLVGKRAEAHAKVASILEDLDENAPPKPRARLVAAAPAVPTGGAHAADDAVTGPRLSVVDYKRRMGLM